MKQPVHRRKKSVAVSALADYADDPAGHCDRRGGPRSSAAARRGDQAHARRTANRSRVPIAWILIAIVVSYIVYLTRPLWLN